MAAMRNKMKGGDSFEDNNSASASDCAGDADVALCSVQN